MTDKNKNIDKLFTSGLENDNPAFKEEYWTQFEKMLDNSGQPDTSPKQNSSGFKGSGSFIKGLIITAISGIIITAIVLLLNHDGFNKSETPQSHSVQKENNSISDDNQPVNSKNKPRIHGANELKAEKNNETRQNKLLKDIREKSVHGQVPVSENELKKQKNDADISLFGKEARKNPDQKITKSEDKINITVISEDQKEETGIEINEITKSNSNEEKSKAPVTRDTDNNLSDKKEGKTPKSIGKKDDKHESGIMEDTLIQMKPLHNAVNESTIKKIDTLKFDTVKEKDSTKLSSSKLEKQAIKEDQKPQKEIFACSILPGFSLYDQVSNKSNHLAKSGFAPTFGFSVRYALNDRLSLSTGAGLLSTKGHRLSYRSEKTYYLIHERKEITTIENTEFYFLEVPLMLHYKIGDHSVGIGPQLRILLNAYGNKTFTVIDPFHVSVESEPVSGYTDGLNWLTGGIGIEYTYNISDKIAAVLRYNFMFGDFTRDATYPDSERDKINCLNLSLKFKIFNTIKK